MEMPFATVAHGMIAVKVGGRYETEANAGISHFLEHLLFKESDETDRFGPLDAIRKTGGSVNAMTDMEVTTYYFTVLPEHFDTAMEALAGLVLQLQFSSGDFERERKVVLEELAMGKNDPRALVLAQLVREIFPGSPLANLVIGTEESIEGITETAVRDFHDTYYIPGNMTVIAAGNIDAADKLEWMRALFQNKPSGTVTTPAFEKPEPAVNAIAKKIPINQSFYIYGALAPGRNSDDYYTMEVLHALFGSGVNSRLHRRLVTEQGITEQLYPLWYTYSNTGIWAVFLSVGPEDVDRVAYIVDEEMLSIQRGEAGTAELEAAKQAVISRKLLSVDRPEDIARFQLDNLLYRDRVIPISEYIDSIEEVSGNDVSELARYYFSAENRVTIEMEPVHGPRRWLLILKYLITKRL
jgi:predicted Zn-dependent peptidase